MILIADGGSTKCDWAVVDSSHATLVKQFQTEGINPFAREEAEILTLLKVDVLPQTADYTIDKIYLYGAGITPEKGKIMEQLLLSVFEGAKVSATSDMEGAARGTVGSGDGIVVILGTGSNSAYYSGGQSVEKVAALGYILGDEGGGAVLGRTLLGDIFKGVAPQHISEQFEAEYGLSQAEVLEAVYRRPQANRYLAGFAKFLSSRLDDHYIYALVERCFED